MIHYHLKRFLLSPTELHIICAMVALVCCIPALFPEICPEEIEETICGYTGTALMSASIFSFGSMVIAGIIHIIRLNNVKAFGQFVKWALVWSAAIGLFLLLALAANVPPPEDAGNAHPIQTTDTLFPPRDALTGPESLTIPIQTENQAADTIADLPNLTALENDHAELLRNYLERSPRWQGKLNDDAFYSKPGHLVMVPPTASGTPGLVHVCFRHLTEGAALPSGYTVVRPGDPFPAEEGDTRRDQVSDLAIDLGRNHYLLLAWRGTAHIETAHKALNGALAAIDARMQQLAQAPTQETVERLLAGRESYVGTAPEIRLAEPLGQEGSYQAEVYANPGEPGTLLLYVRELEGGSTLRLFSCPAKYSANKEEVFRHNFPCDVPTWMRAAYSERISSVLPKDSPVFIIDTESRKGHFGAVLEIWFKPADAHRPQYRLLRRCYRVQSYDAAPLNTQQLPAAPLPAAAD